VSRRAFNIESKSVMCIPVLSKSFFLRNLKDSVLKMSRIPLVVSRLEAQGFN